MASSLSALHAHDDMIDQAGADHLSSSSNQQQQPSGGEPLGFGEDEEEVLLTTDASESELDDEHQLIAMLTYMQSLLPGIEQQKVRIRLDGPDEDLEALTHLEKHVRAAKEHVMSAVQELDMAIELQRHHLIRSVSRQSSAAFEKLSKASNHDNKMGSPLVAGPRKLGKTTPNSDFVRQLPLTRSQSITTDYDSPRIGGRRISPSASDAEDSAASSTSKQHSETRRRRQSKSSSVTMMLREHDATLQSSDTDEMSGDSRKSSSRRRYHDDRSSDQKRQKNRRADADDTTSSSAGGSRHHLSESDGSEDVKPAFLRKIPLKGAGGVTSDFDSPQVSSRRLTSRSLITPNHRDNDDDDDDGDGDVAMIEQQRPSSRSGYQSSRI